jgi:hypothetical protein
VLPVDLRALPDARPALRATDLRSAAVVFLARARPPFRATTVLSAAVLLRARARPPLRPAAAREAAVDFFRVVLPVLVFRAVVFRAVVFLPVVFRVVVFLPVVFRVVVRLRVPVVLRAVDFLRRVVLRAVALPPLRPAATTEGALPVVDLLRVLRAVDFLRVPVVLRAVARPPLRPAAAREVDFLRVPDVLRVPVVLRAVLLRPVVFLRVDDDFLVVVDLRVLDDAAVFRAVDFLPLELFLRVLFLRVARTGLRVDKPDSVPKMSELVSDVPVSMSIARVPKVASSEPDATTPAPSSSGGKRLGSSNPLSSAMTPLSVECLLSTVRFPL